MGGRRGGYNALNWEMVTTLRLKGYSEAHNVLNWICKRDTYHEPYLGSGKGEGEEALMGYHCWVESWMVGA